MERLRLNGWAFTGLNAFIFVITEESRFASASGGFANTWAQWIGIFARAIATSAFLIDFIFLALLDWWEHHQQFRLNLSRAFTGLDAFSIIITEMTLFAGATGNADTRAQGVGILASTIASFALTIFFVITANLRDDGQSFFSRNAARFRLNADAVFVFQESGFAEATDDAVAGAFRARVRVGAGGRASGSATEKDFVFFALRNFWRKSEELHSFGGIALGGWHADAASITQMTFITEATDDAVLGANWAWMGIGAGGGACRAAWIEKFIGRAFGFGLRELHGDFVVAF